jgi:hypothetical protein
MEKPAARIGSRELTRRELSRLLLDEACLREGITVSYEESRRGSRA